MGRKPAAAAAKVTRTGVKMPTRGSGGVQPSGDAVSFDTPEGPRTRRAPQKPAAIVPPKPRAVKPQNPAPVMFKAAGARRGRAAAPPAQQEPEPAEDPYDFHPGDTPPRQPPKRVNLRTVRASPKPERGTPPTLLPQKPKRPPPPAEIPAAPEAPSNDAGGAAEQRLPEGRSPAMEISALVNPPEEDAPVLAARQDFSPTPASRPPTTQRRGRKKADGAETQAAGENAANGQAAAPQTDHLAVPVVPPPRGRRVKADPDPAPQPTAPPPATAERPRRGKTPPMNISPSDPRYEEAPAPRNPPPQALPPSPPNRNRRRTAPMSYAEPGDNPEEDDDVVKPARTRAAKAPAKNAKRFSPFTIKATPQLPPKPPTPEPAAPEEAPEPEPAAEKDVFSVPLSQPEQTLDPIVEPTAPRIALPPPPARTPAPAPAPDPGEPESVDTDSSVTGGPRSGPAEPDPPARPPSSRRTPASAASQHPPKSTSARKRPSSAAEEQPAKRARNAASGPSNRSRSSSGGAPEAPESELESALRDFGLRYRYERNRHTRWVEVGDALNRMKALDGGGKTLEEICAMAVLMIESETAERLLSFALGAPVRRELPDSPQPTPAACAFLREHAQPEDWKPFWSSVAKSRVGSIQGVADAWGEFEATKPRSKRKSGKGKDGAAPAPGKPASPAREPSRRSLRTQREASVDSEAAPPPAQPEPEPEPVPEPVPVPSPQQEKAREAEIVVEQILAVSAERTQAMQLPEAHGSDAGEPDTEMDSSPGPVELRMDDTQLEDSTTEMQELPSAAELLGRVTPPQPARPATPPMSAQAEDHAADVVHSFARTPNKARVRRHTGQAASRRSVSTERGGAAPVPSGNDAVPPPAEAQTSKYFAPPEASQPPVPRAVRSRKPSNEVEVEIELPVTASQAAIASRRWSGRRPATPRERTPAMQPEDLPVPAAQRPAHGSRSRSPSSSPDPVVTEERVLAQPHTRRRSGKPGTPPSQDSQIPYGGIRLQMPEDSLQDSIVALGHAPDPRKVVGKTAEEEGTFQALDQWISEFDRRLPMPEKFRLTPVALTYEEPGRGSPEESSQPHERAPMQLFVQETQPLPNESEEEFVDASDIMQVDPPPERQPSLDREQHPPSTHSELDEDIVPATPQDTTRPRAEFLRTVEKPKSHSPRIPWIETGKRPTVRHSPSKAKISPDASRPGSARTQADDYRAPPLRSIRYADHVKQGYRMGSRHDPRPIKIHEHMEDAHAIRERMEHKPTGLNYSLFLVADGHGGPDCAKYVAEELPDMIRKELDKVDADEWNQNRIVEAVECAIKTTDKEYLEVIKRRFEKWKKSGADETKKPADDGSTLVLNLVFPDFAEPWSGGEWLLNVNIGDSRTCVLQTQHRARFRFEPTFISEDHHPGHPEKAHHIVHGTAASAIIKVSRPGQGQNLTIPKGLHAQVGTKEEGPKKRHIEALRAGRVVRTEEYLGPHSQAVLLGLNVTQHINCGDAMGDLLFKLDPPVFQCKPDMTWVRLEPDRRYIICMATDGLWDAFKVPTSQFVRQAEEIAGIIQRAMQDEVNRNVFQSASYAGDSLPDEVVQQKLKSFAVGLGELQRNEFKIFTDHTVYDDVTVLLVDVAEAA